MNGVHRPERRVVGGTGGRSTRTAEEHTGPVTTGACLRVGRSSGRVTVWAEVEVQADACDRGLFKHADPDYLSCKEGPPRGVPARYRLSVRAPTPKSEAEVRIRLQTHAYATQVNISIKRFYFHT